MGKVHKVFNSLPGVDGINGFCKRPKEVLRERFCELIKGSRATVTTETINSYFDNHFLCIRHDLYENNLHCLLPTIW